MMADGGSNMINDRDRDIILRMRDAFRELKAQGRLCHGSGVIDYGDWALRL